MTDDHLSRIGMNLLMDFLRNCCVKLLVVLLELFSSNNAFYGKCVDAISNKVSLLWTCCCYLPLILTLPGVYCVWFCAICVLLVTGAIVVLSIYCFYIWIGALLCAIV